MSVYTLVTKPTDSTYSSVPRDIVEYPQYGTAIYGTSEYGRQDTYTDVAKPTFSITWALATTAWEDYTLHVWGSPNYYQVAKPIT